MSDRPKKVHFKCKMCGVETDGFSHHRRICKSKECVKKYEEWRKSLPPFRKEFTCKVCGKRFEALRTIDRKTCGKKCQIKWIWINIRADESKLDKMREVATEMGHRNRGRTSWRKGKTRFLNELEKKEAMLASGRRCYRKHIEARLFYYRQLSYKRRTTEGVHTKEDWERIKKEHGYCCAGCGRQEPFTEQRYQKLTEDHIIPISQWKEWVKSHPVDYKCNDIENIQPLCLSCNVKKWKKLPEIKL